MDGMWGVADGSGEVLHPLEGDLKLVDEVWGK